MKQRSLFIRVIIFFVTLAGFIALFYYKDTNAYYNLPVLEFKTINGNTIETKDFINDNIPCAILFFHPDCSFCENEIKEVLASCVKGSNYEWLMITVASKDQAELYFHSFNIDIARNIHIISEEESLQAYRIYDVSSPPAIFIYNSNGKLIWHRKGETKSGEIAKINNKK